MNFLVLLLSLFLFFGCDYQEEIDKVVDSETDTTEEVEHAVEEPEEIELIINEELEMIKILKIEEASFFWVSENSIQGFKNGDFKPLKIEAEKTESGEKTIIEIKPKDFFVLNHVLYFSADIDESNPNYDPEIEGSQQTMTVERFYSQAKGGQVIEIDSLPAQPEAERIEVNDGKYNVFIADFQGHAVSDIHRLTDARYCGRNIKISGYWYGYSESFQHTGAFIDVQEGLSGVRDAGLYFVNDRFTSQVKCAPAGRMWVY